jgi:hypothetical protein
VKSGFDEAVQSFAATEPNMRTRHPSVNTDDYVRRIDRMIMVTGIIAATLAASLIF